MSILEKSSLIGTEKYMYKNDHDSIVCSGRKRGNYLIILQLKSGVVGCVDTISENKWTWINLIT